MDFQPVNHDDDDDDDDDEISQIETTLLFTG